MSEMSAEIMSSNSPWRGLLAPGRLSGGKGKAIAAELGRQAVDRFGDIHGLRLSWSQNPVIWSWFFRWDLSDLKTIL